ncbi:MAG TPA: aldehyde dehydrogenase family protein [Methanoregulaceae archaeon]|nr:aldehyde dehydrogenase family protein [Methanoregulaceae archaeon]
MVEVGMRINGSEVAAAGGATIAVMNPANGEQIVTIPRGTAEDIGKASDAAATAFPGWKAVRMRDRGRVLFAAAQEGRRQVADLARLLTTEQGKPLREATDEIRGFCNVLEYYASLSAQPLDQFIDLGAGSGAVVRQDPLGTVGAIIPWNMPALIMAWKTAPALLAGNAVILKPSSTAPLTVLRLAGILEKSGLPPGTLNVVTGTGGEAGEALLHDPGIAALSFTGSSATGEHVCEVASRAGVMVNLELGGSDPMVVMPDADIDAAVRGAVHGRFYNAGQVCSAVKRLFVHETIADEFQQKLAAAVREVRVGNGLDPEARMGPLNNPAGYDRIRELVSEVSTKEEGTVLTGGEAVGHLPENGLFFMPTIVTDVAPDSRLLSEEVFGPVLPVATFKDLDAAIRMANSTQYGLGASVWTHDTRVISRYYAEVHAGVVWVNRHVSVPPEIPFGGTGKSGSGRENGSLALLHYTKPKTLYYGP